MSKNILKIFFVIIINFMTSCDNSETNNDQSQSLEQEQNRDRDRDDPQKRSNTMKPPSSQAPNINKRSVNPYAPFTKSEKSDIQKFKNKVEACYEENSPNEEEKSKAKKAFNDLVNKIKADPKEINSTDSYHGSTLLMYASQQGNTKMVNLLLDKKANINKKGKNEITALHFAVSSGNKETVELLLNKGANLNIKSKIDIGDKKEERNIMEYALGTIYNWNKKLKGNSEIIKLLIEKGKFSVNSKDMPGNNNDPLILRAATRGDVDFAKYLINKDADIDSQNSNKYTPLLTAAENGDLDMLKLLIKNKADLTKRDEWGNGVLHRALSPSLVDSSDALEFLMKQNLDPNSIDKYGETPIFSACDQFSRNAPEMALKMIKILLKNNKTNPNHISKNGNFPLLEAVTESTYEIVKILLAYKADPQQIYKNKTKENKTIETTALLAGFANQKWGNTERIAKNISLLIPYASDYEIKVVAKMVGVKNFETSDWIWEAMMNKMTKFNLSADELNTINVVKLCLKHPEFKNIDINKKNEKGKTLLDIAKSKNYKEVLKLLKQKGAKMSV